MATIGPGRKASRGQTWLCNGKRLMGFEPTTFCMAIREVTGDLDPQSEPFAGLL
jgi:hypothetical protein